MDNMNTLNIDSLVSDEHSPLHQFNLLTSLFHDFSSSLDIETTLKNATHLIKQYLDAEGVALFLLDNNDTELVCRVAASEPDISGLRMDANKGIIGRALRENKTQMIRDVSEDKDFYSGVDEETGATTHSILCVPLSVQDHKLGAFEAINKSSENGLFSQQDRDLLTILGSIAAMAIYNAQLVEELLEQDRTHRELELAREIQTALLPKEIENQKIFGLNLSARKLSGDFYNYFQLPDGRIFFTLGDVAGKGANAALLMAKTTSLFRCLGKATTSPADLLFQINNEIYESITRGLFVTMVIGIYDPKENLVTLANAGHQPPLYVDKDLSISSLEIASPPVGVLPDTTYEEYSVSLEKCAIYIFTDGLTECWEKPQSPLGEDGVKRAITKFSSVPAASRLDEIISDITTWKREASGYLFDDITMLLIQDAENN